MRLNPLVRLNDDNHPQLRGVKTKAFRIGKATYVFCVCIGGVTGFKIAVSLMTFAVRACVGAAQYKNQ